MMKENETTDLYHTLEAPLVKVLTAIEYEGVYINEQFLKDYSVELREIIDKQLKEIHEEAGVVFNVGSPKQVGEVLFDKLEIPYRWRKTASGKYSTDVEKLTELAEKHDIVKKILQYRKYSKLKSTYVDALPLMINPKTGRVHSNFNQARAATGRLSSDKPNLQNIPIRDEAGRKIRKAFEPRDEEHILLAADYSQIELRLMYMDDTVAYAREHGYVKTMLGRRRVLRDINSRNGLTRSNAERMAIAKASNKDDTTGT